MKNPFSLNFLFEQKSDKTMYPVCPKCISPKLNILKEFTSGWLTSPRYVCSVCNYTGTVILEIDLNMLEEYTPEEIKKMYYDELISDELEKEFE